MSLRRRPKRPHLMAPLPLGAVLDAAGEHRHSPWPPPIALRLWTQLVGPQIARRSEPKSLRDGVLLVQVTCAAWAQELSLLQSSLLARLQKAGFSVHTLRFRTGPLPGNEPPPPAPPAPKPKPVPANVRAALRTVDDAELRDLLQDLSQYLIREET